MTTKIFHPGRLSLYAVLSLLDLALTYRLLQAGGGHVYESNPIANAWLSKYGWSGLALFKMMSMTLVIMAAVVVSTRHPQMGARVMTFACTAVAVVVIYSCSLANFFGNNLQARTFKLDDYARQRKETLLKQAAPLLARSRHGSMEAPAFPEAHGQAPRKRWLPSPNRELLEREPGTGDSTARTAEQAERPGGSPVSMADLYYAQLDPQARAAMLAAWRQAQGRPRDVGAAVASEAEDTSALQEGGADR